MEKIYYKLNPWWKNQDFNSGTDRKDYWKILSESLKRNQLELIIGGRGTGKSTIIKQFIKKLISEKISPEKIIYLSMDYPPLLGISLSEHLKKFKEIFNHKEEDKLFIFMDEIQEHDNWKNDLKELSSLQNLKIYCIGSNSSLLIRQDGSTAGNRIINTVYPLCFNEFLTFKKPEGENVNYTALLEEYLETGGYPSQALNPSLEYMSDLLNNILARDVARFFPVKKSSILMSLMRIIANSLGKRTSYNKIEKSLTLTDDTIKEYISYLEYSFLVSSMERKTSSYSKKIYGQKKIYLCDNGIKSLFTGEGDLEIKAENAVYMELKRKGIDCGYFAQGEKEVDFIIEETNLPVDVKYMSSFDINDSICEGLKLLVKKRSNHKKLLLISKDIEEEINSGRTVIKLVPLWKFLLSSEEYIK